MKNICVIGSINMDLVTILTRFPKPGETIRGKEFSMFFGGKGANQAVAASRLGASVSIIGKVGDDTYGKLLLDNLSKNHVDISCVSVEKNCSSGIACIQIDEHGENSIVIIEGANGKVSDIEIDNFGWAIEKSDIIMLQLELPIETVKYAVEIGKRENNIVILDPAPACDLPDSIYKHIDIITPNETEMQILTGINTDSESSIKTASDMLKKKGVPTVICKAGKNGAYIMDDYGFRHIRGYSVNAVDTTAAGDSFNAALAVGLSEGKNIDEAVDYANLVAAISTTKLGAQSAMPTRKEVDSFVNSINM